MIIVNGLHLLRQIFGDNHLKHTVHIREVYTEQCEMELITDFFHKIKAAGIAMAHKLIYVISVILIVEIIAAAFRASDVRTESGYHSA